MVHVIDEETFRTIVEREESVPKNVDKWFAFNYGTGKLFLIPKKEFNGSSTRVEDCTAVVKKHYPLYEYAEDGYAVLYRGCMCEIDKKKTSIRIEADPVVYPETWEEVLLHRR